MTSPALEHFVAGTERFKQQYANPLLRIPMTLTEIFPLGVLVSLVSAALVRDSRSQPTPRNTGSGST